MPDVVLPLPQKKKASIRMNIKAKKSNTSARFWGRNVVPLTFPKKNYKSIHKSHDLRLI